MSKEEFAEFEELDDLILSEFEKDKDYRDFLKDPKDFRSLNHVMTLLRDAKNLERFESHTFDENPIYMDLIEKRNLVKGIIEKVVKFQHGGLNTTVETMGEVVKAYIKGRDEIKTLRVSLHEAREVLTNKNKSQMKLKDLWLQKSELEETLRIIKNLEFLKDAPSRIQKLVFQRRYLAAVTTLNKSIDMMFHEDLMAVPGLSVIRENLLELKENILDKILNELQEAIHGTEGELDGVTSGTSGGGTGVDSGGLRAGGGGGSYDDDGIDDDDNYDDNQSEGSRGTDMTDMTPGMSGGGGASSEYNIDETSTVVSNSAGGGGGGGGPRIPLDRQISTYSMNKFNMSTATTTDPLQQSVMSSILSSSITREQMGVIMNLTDTIENDLKDPSKTGLLFIRLLVKSISDLNKEEDMERLLLNQLGLKFRNKIIKYEKQIATTKLRKKLNELEYHQNNALQTGNILHNLENSTLEIQSKVFTKYISNLLSHSVSCLKRISFVLRLLYFSQVLRVEAEQRKQYLLEQAYDSDENNNDNNEENEDEDEDDRDNNTGNVDEDDNDNNRGNGFKMNRLSTRSKTKLPFFHSKSTDAASESLNSPTNKYYDHVFNPSSTTSTSTSKATKTMSVQKQNDSSVSHPIKKSVSHTSLSYHHHPPHNISSSASSFYSQDDSAGGGLGGSNSTTNQLEYHMKPINRVDVCHWWNEIETIICNELKVHFKEKDVENISDQYLIKNKTNTRLLTSNTSPRDSGDGVGGGEDDLDDIHEISDDTSQLLVPPTAKLASPLYKEIVSYYQLTSRLLVEEGWYLSSSSSQSSSSDELHALASTNNTSGNKGKGLTILQQLAKEKDRQELLYHSQVMEYIDSFIEMELLPITQSYVNTEMREIQVNASLFSYQYGSSHHSRTGGGGGKTNSLNRHPEKSTATSATDISRSHTIVFLNQSILINAATLKCAQVSQLLFNYWYQLNKHQLIVETIYDRLVRGFVSSAKEEMENIGWNSLSYDDKYKNPAFTLLNTNDPFYCIYRKKLYRGHLTIEAYIASKLKSYTQSHSNTTTSTSAASGVTPPPPPAYTVMNPIKGDDRSTGGRNPSLMSTPPAAGGGGGNRRVSVMNMGREIESSMDFSLWGVLFGSIGNSSNYPVHKDKMIRDYQGLGTIASISLGCDWLSYELIKYCDYSTAKYLKDIASHISAEGTRTAASISSDNNTAHLHLWSTTEDVSKQLAKISASALSFLKSEVQLVCFMHLHQLASSESLKAIYTSIHMGSNTARSVATTQAYSARGKFGNMYSNTQQDSNFDNYNDGNMKTSRESDSDIILNELVYHLNNIYEVIQPVLPKDMIVVIMFPLCGLIPRIVMRCIQFLIQPPSSMLLAASKASSTTTSTFHSSSKATSPIITTSKSSITPVPSLPLNTATGSSSSASSTTTTTTGGMNTAANATSSSSSSASMALDNVNKYLRLVTSIQQMVTTMMETFQWEPASSRMFSDILIEETERIRKYLKLTEMNCKELKGYIRENADEYTSVEYKTLWDCMCVRSEEKQVTFEEYWKTIK